jgi:hypothetical protein
MSTQRALAEVSARLDRLEVLHHRAVLACARRAARRLNGVACGTQ